MNWSDDEETVMTQPAREMPPSESEDEYMHIIITKTKNIDICSYMEKSDKDNKKKQKKNVKKNDTLLFFNTDNKNIRKFNPRLPPPEKYKK